MDSVHDLAEFLTDPKRVVADDRLVASSPAMLELVQQAGRVAASSAAVLIEGETGTGKELIARLIHGASPRADKPYVRVNCAALSDTLIESEMFGHERGAFTGAGETRLGRFEMAHGGTLLLDEVSEMSVHLQAKLLRVLEEGEFERVGGVRTLSVDVRVLATTNRRLEDEIAANCFRRDLFYRLGVVRLHLPPLRERREEIPLLAEYFLRAFRDECRVREISSAAMQILSAYDWPGNVRELRNVIHRASILAAGMVIEPGDLPALKPHPGAAEWHALEGRTTHPAATDRTLRELEWETILRTLQQCGGNKTAAARKLGVTARTLLNKMNKYRKVGHSPPSQQ